MEEKKLTVHEIVKKLVGPISPVGETTADNRRFENLKAMTQVVDRLLFDINEVAVYNNGRHEYSMKRAGEYAGQFLDNVREEE